MTENTKKWKNAKNGKSMKIENYRKSAFPEITKRRIRGKTRKSGKTQKVQKRKKSKSRKLSKSGDIQKLTFLGVKNKN